MNPKPGDWIRFQRNGALVLGMVAYVVKADYYPWHDEAVTDVGSVDVEDILEVRRAED